MSNTNDPKNPKKPDPNDPDKKGEDGRGPMSGSSYDFDMTGDLKSYGDLPPIPQPDMGDTSGAAALPPRPETARPTAGSFDFIDIDAELEAQAAQAVTPGLPTRPVGAALTGPKVRVLVATRNVEPNTPITGDLLREAFEWKEMPQASVPDAVTETRSVLGRAFKVGVAKGRWVSAGMIGDAPAPAPAPAVPPKLVTPAPTAAKPPAVAPKPAPPVRPAPPAPAAPVAPRQPSTDIVIDLPSGRPPAAPKKSDPGPARPEAPRAPVGGGSSYDFDMTGDLKSYGDLPPIPQPDMGDTSGAAALPPRPEALRPTAGSFDFIDIDAELEARSGSVPPAPGLAPTDGIIALPPRQPSTDIVIEMPSEPVLTPTPNPGTLPPVPDSQSVVDIGTLFPTSDPPSSFVLGASAARAPGGAPAPTPPSDPSTPELPPVPGGAFTISSADIDLGPLPTEPGSQIPFGVAASAPDVAGPPSDDAGLPTIPEGAAASGPDVDLGGPAATVPEALAASGPEIDLGGIGESPSSVFSAAPASSLDFDLGSSTEMPSGPIPEAYPVGSGEFDLGPPSDSHSAVDVGTLYKTDDQPSSFTLGQAEPLAPPRTPSEPSLSVLLPPPEVPGTDPSVPAMGSSGSTGSLGSIPDISVLYPAKPAAPGGFAGSNAIPELELPPRQPGDPDSKVGVGEHLPVTPSAAWLDSEIFKSRPGEGDAIPSAEPVPDATDATEDSDIFSPGRAAPGAPTEHSDVLSATAYPPGGRTDPDLPGAAARPSDVALTFDGPPGGSTIPDGHGSDLLMAAEVTNDSDLLGTSAPDSESIHDLPDPARDPLFDSATLATAPDLPGTRPDDAPDFGAIPTHSSDASSILADLTSPDVELNDDSSVRVEAPGVNRTLTGSPAEGAFDLTVTDDPPPSGLFDDPVAVPPSGSDLLGGRTDAEFDLGRAGRGEPVDVDLSSPASAPSSIFSGARADEPAPTDPELGESAAELGETAERPPGAPVVPAPRRLSSADFQLPPTDGEVDWDAVDTDEGATRGVPRDESLSAVMRQLTDDPNDTRDAPARPGAVDDDGNPVVTVDWVAGSAEGSAVTDLSKTDPAARRAKGRRPDEDFEEKPTKPAAPAKPAKPVVKKTAAPRPAVADDSGTADRARAEPPKKGGSRAVIGALVGGLLATGLAAGAYFGDVLPDPKAAERDKLLNEIKGLKQQIAQQPTAPTTGAGPGPAVAPPAAPVADPRAALLDGDADAALKWLKGAKIETAEQRAAAGAVRVLAAVQGNGAERDQGRKDLQEAIATFNDTANRDTDVTKKAAAIRQAVQATVYLGASYEAANEPGKARELFEKAKKDYPTHAAIFDAQLDRLGAAAGAGTSFHAPRRLTPEEAERLLLAVTVLLADPPKADEPEEPGVYFWKARKLADAKDFAGAIKQVTAARDAHNKRAKALAGRGLNPLTDPLEQMFPRACDDLIASWTILDQLYRHPATADAVKGGTLPKALDGFASAGNDLKAAKEGLKAAKDDAAKFEKEAKLAKDDLGKLEKEAKLAKDDAAKFEKDYKAAEKARVEAADKLKTAETTLKTAETTLKTAEASLKEAQKDAADKGKTLDAIAAELKPAKVLPEKWGPADLIAGTKTVTGLAAGDAAERAVKAEKAAKEAKLAQEAAEKKLDTETKALTKKYEGDIDALKKKQVDEAAKLADKFKDDAKKLTAKFEDDAKKLTADHDKALKAEQAKTDEEKKKVAAQAVAFEKQLANAITPSRAVDLWLPVLADLRRPADADPALALATRALESAAPDSEDEAKALTAIGMAQVLKTNFADAKVRFQAARRGEAYKTAAAAGKYWTKVADTGLEATVDPQALYRLPVVIPPTDPKTANKALDAGISAYKVGNYDEATKALAVAAKNDPADPLAWYYLGAARWATGAEEQARKDFAQGGEREKASPIPGRLVSAALAPIQGAARGALDKARP